MKKNILIAVIIASAFFLGFFIRSLFTTSPSNSFGEIYEKHQGQKKLINPLVYYNIPPSKELGPFRIILEGKIESLITNKKASSIGIYYRDLNNGPWVGINEDEKYTPASILKVPIMLAYFKEAEHNPEVLSKKIKFDTNTDLNVGMYYKVRKPIEQGQEYTIKQLIDHMIEYSDNNAMILLFNNIETNKLNDLYKELGITLPTSGDAEDYMSPINVSLFFRVLYNATYLNQEMSEKALELLTRVDFTEGIVKGIPKEILSAQKYGEKIDSGGKELHDCGIVYYPGHPYLLCVMTEGNDYEDLSQVIADISKLTYEQVKKSNN